MENTATTVYTYTLKSGNVLLVQGGASLGDVIIGCLLLSVVAVLILDISVRVAFRR